VIEQRRRKQSDLRLESGLAEQRVARFLGAEGMEERQTREIARDVGLVRVQPRVVELRQRAVRELQIGRASCRERVS
jgi:hypothetical protein